jgi:hypothetical protein
MFGPSFHPFMHSPDNGLCLCGDLLLLCGPNILSTCSDYYVGPLYGLGLDETTLILSSLLQLESGTVDFFH